jgi:glycerophosphoryl diester phosphodiesterase
MNRIYIISLLLIIGLYASAQVKYIAHRGASYYAPENTLAAIKLAWELGSDGAECDIRLTKDNQIILCHDATTERVAGQKLEIARSTYAQLKKMDIKLLKNNSIWFEGQKIPLLKDVLMSMKKDQLLVIEIKCGKEIFPELQKVIRKYWTTGNIAFIGFGFETISMAKAVFPAIPCYYLSSAKADLSTKIPDIKRNRLDGVDLSSGIIDQQLVAELKKADLDIWCWTVDVLAEANRMKELGVNVITTNRPTWLKEQMAITK